MPEVTCRVQRQGCVGGRQGGVGGARYEQPDAPSPQLHGHAHAGERPRGDGGGGQLRTAHRAHGEERRHEAEVGAVVGCTDRRIGPRAVVIVPRHLHTADRATGSARLGARGIRHAPRA